MKINKAPTTKIVPQSVRGMRDLIGEESFKLQGLFEKAAEVALYYGFQPLELPILEKRDLFTSGIGGGTDIVEKELYTLRTKGGDKLALRPEFTAGAMRAYLEHGFQTLPQPVMLYSFGAAFRHDRPQAGRFRQFYQFNLEILGTEKSIADATTIHVALVILKEAGLDKAHLELNTIGDRECRPVFKRELTSYYKKRLDKLCPDCNRRFKNNPLRLLDCKNEDCKKIKEGAPYPVSYLCPPCKKHLKEVLEYLEALGIEYVINNNLVRGLDYYSRTVFEIFENGDTTKALASGGRYDGLARALGANRDVPSVGVALGCDRIIALSQFSALIPRIVKKPKIFFIQLGFEAKLKGLPVTEVLRQAKVPVIQHSSKDALSLQLSAAEKLNVPYAMILGQKEVLEGTVIVRNLNTRSQEVVKMEELPGYLKGLK